MWKLILLSIAIAMIVSAEGAVRKRYATTSGYAGASSGASAGGGAGYFGGTGFDDYDYGYAPDFGFGFIDPFQFHQHLTAQILAEHAANQNAIASTYTSGPATATADASSLPDDNRIAQQHAYFRPQAAYASGYKGNRYAPNYAAASGSIGPGGYHQSAYINPANPAIPNVDSRFGSISSPGGYKGVSVSSFSSSSDVNGHKTGYRGAQTTINDNGKVTTYRVHS